MQQGAPAFFQQQNAPRPASHQQYPSFEGQPQGYQPSPSNLLLRPASFVQPPNQNTFDAQPRVSADSLFKRLNIDKQPDRAASFQFRATPPLAGGPQSTRAASTSHATDAAALLNILNPRGQTSSKPKQDESTAPLSAAENKPAPANLPAKDNMQALLDSLKASSLKASSSENSRPASTTGKVSKAQVDNKSTSISSPAARSPFTYTNPFEQLAAASPRNAQVNQMPAADVFGELPKTKKTSDSPLAATPISTVTPQADESVKPTQKPAVVEQIISKPLIEEVASETISSPKVETPKIESPVAKREILKPASPKHTGADVPSATKSQNTSPSSKQDESIIDDWETALGEGGDDKTEIKSRVDVYSFPVKPFISIAIKPDVVTRADFKSDDNSVMQIARLKKTFDQNDRTLVTATRDYIIFAMSRNGGVRIIRQDSGKDKKIFEETQDQIFNVSASVARDNGAEAVVATGCSGTVYWFMIKDSGGDRIEEFTPHFSFSLPPIQSPGDENPGGVLKTRARKSSNHTEFFAVGRGKSIHIIFPNIITKGGFYQPGTVRTVDVEKYLAHRTLKIDTGKAAKDFTFSQDDTTVVSLDKAGRIKFWDIRRLTSDDIKNQSVELKEPLMTVYTTQPNEKSWPTSITFVDKVWPYAKNSALRYLVVGMKQNHTLQLWDLALNKVAQEIQLPHDKESDAACSVVYHKDTSMLVVGHPTRNSIYFIHLSFPKYDLPRGLSQADFISRIAGNDNQSLYPKDTAIMRAIREYAFSDGDAPKSGSDKRSRGDLRSLDILSTPINEHDPSILFEIFTMHSTGVTSIPIRPDDLGLTSKLTDINAKSADEAGLIEVTQLKQISQPIKDAPSAPLTSPFSPPPAAITPKVILTKDGARKLVSTTSPEESGTQRAVETPSRKEKVDITPTVVNGGQESTVNVVEKSEKKKKRKAASGRAVEASTEIGSPVPRAASTVNLPSVESAADIASRTIMAKKLDKVESDMVELSKKFTATSEDSLQRYEKYHKEQTIAGDTKMRSLLTEVQRVIVDSTDKRLTMSFEECSKNIITPALQKTLESAVQDNVASSVRKELQSLLPQAVSNGLNNKQLSSSIAREVQQNLTKSLSEAISVNIAGKIGPLVNTQISSAISAKIVPAIAGLTKENSVLQQSLSTFMAQSEAQHKNDAAQIEKLQTAVVQMMSIVSDMAAHQQTWQKKSEEREDQLKAIIEQSNAQNSALTRGIQESVGSPVSPGTNTARFQQEPAQQQASSDGDEDESSSKKFANAQEIWMFLAEKMQHRAYEDAFRGWLLAAEPLVDAVFAMNIPGFEPRILAGVPFNFSFLVLKAVGLFDPTNASMPAVENRVGWLRAAIEVTRNHIDEIGWNAKPIIANFLEEVNSKMETLVQREIDPTLRRIGSAPLAKLRDSIVVTLNDARALQNDLSQQ